MQIPKKLSTANLPCRYLRVVCLEKNASGNMPVDLSSSSPRFSAKHCLAVLVQKKPQHIKPVLRFFVSALQYRPELQQVAKVQSKAKTNCNNFFAVRVLPCLHKALPCRAFQDKPQHIKPVLRFFVSALRYRPELQQVAKVQSKAKTNCNNFFAVRVDMPCKQ